MLINNFMEVLCLNQIYESCTLAESAGPSSACLAVHTRSPVSVLDYMHSLVHESKHGLLCFLKYRSLNVHIPHIIHISS